MNHRDPAYCNSFIQSSPEAAGRNILSVLCCNYVLIKSFAEPFLNTSRGVQNIADGTIQCVHHSRSRLQCASTDHLSPDEEYYLERSRYEDERKGRVTYNTYSIIARVMHNLAIAFSYLLILLFVYLCIMYK